MQKKLRTMTKTILKKSKTSKFQIKYVFLVSMDAKKAENYDEYIKKLKTSR